MRGTHPTSPATSNQAPLTAFPRMAQPVICELEGSIGCLSKTVLSQQQLIDSQSRRINEFEILKQLYQNPPPPPVTRNIWRL
jgi:hypothetical protein